MENWYIKRKRMLKQTSLEALLMIVQSSDNCILNDYNLANIPDHLILKVLKSVKEEKNKYD